MDNLTHSLTGLALNRAGLGRTVPHAAWILVLAANAPDIDVVSLFQGSPAYLGCHRGFTHSLAFVPVMAVLPVLIVRLFARHKFDWKGAYLVSLLGAATHPALDWLNSYGVRLLWPFSSEWFQGSLANVVDLWMWAALLTAAVWPLLSRLVSSEIGARSGTGKGIAIFALSFLLVYNSARFVLHQRAIAVLDARMYQGHVARRVAAFPDFANPFHWVGLVEGENFYMRHDVNLLGEFDPASGRVYYKPDPSPAIAAARQTRAFREFLTFSQYPFWRVVPLDEPEGGVRVQAMDLRFGPPSDPHFVATAVVDRSNRVEKSWFSFRDARARN